MIIDHLRSGESRSLLWSFTGILLFAGTVFSLRLIPLNFRSQFELEKNLAALNGDVGKISELTENSQDGLRNQYSEFEKLSTLLPDLQSILCRTGLITFDITSRPIETREKSIFGQVQLNIRIKGTYREIKIALSKLLELRESLTLDAVTFRRARSTDLLLDAEVRMTFYYRKAL